MSDHDPNPPSPGDSAQGTEYEFPPEHDPLHKDEQQAEASQYGIYGYHGQAGESNLGDSGPVAADEPVARSDLDQPTAGVGEAGGGQRWDQSEYGEGGSQPMQEPQRSAAHSQRPK